MAAREILVASGNPGKLREFAELFAGYGVRILSPAAFPLPEVDETGASFVENALIKAGHAASVTGQAVIADDSGLEVGALNDAPGVYSARYAGPEASDDDNVRLLLKNIAAAGEKKPAARFQCAMVYMDANSGSGPVITRGTWQGYIIDEPRGENGFGYDPVFYVPTHACTAAELPPEIKNAISHRGQALRALAAEITGEK